jgi:hypothetical protein
MNETNTTNSLLERRFIQINEIMTNLFSKVFEPNSNPKYDKRPIYIELDHNMTNISLITEDYISFIIDEIATSFRNNEKTTMTSLGQTIIFIFLYLIVITFGTVSNFCMILAFYRAESLRTLRNSFIITLAIRLIFLLLIQFLSIHQNY